MIRSVLALVVIAVLVVAAVVIADQPGHVAIQWQDWRFDPSIPVFIAALLVAILVAALAIGLLRRILAGPRAFVRARHERRRRAGYRALTQGMVAVAAGDAEEAKRHARKADVLLAEPPLTLLLSAQAAQLNGDERAAHDYFSEMLNRPETEFLGLRGLLTQALRGGDDATALRLAERAHGLRPKTPWVLTSLLELQVRSQLWESAQATLGEAVRRRLLGDGDARRHEAALLYERARAAEAKDLEPDALAFAARAQELAPDLAPAAALRARLLGRAGRDRPAAKAIEAAWRRAPHPLLAAAWGALFAHETPLARVKRFEKLAAANPDHVESHVAVAQAALTAQLWGEARRHLVAAGADAAPAADLAGAPPSARVCRLMAELEEAEHGDGAAARAWLARAAAAPPDPLYVCASCGGESLDWQPLCPRCRAFDTLSWRTPARAAAALPPPTPFRGALTLAPTAPAPGQVRGGNDGGSDAKIARATTPTVDAGGA